MSPAAERRSSSIFSVTSDESRWRHGERNLCEEEMGWTRFSFNNKTPSTWRGFCYLSTELPTGRTVLAVTVSTEQLVKPRRIRVKRKFRYRRIALRAFPISLKHLSLKSTISFKCHFVWYCFINDLRDSRQNGLIKSYISNWNLRTL